MKATQTQIRNVLKAVTFNPKKPGPLKVIVESGNVDYFYQRAVEQLRMAQQLRGNGQSGAQEALVAMQLIALAIVEEGNGRAKVEDEG